MKPGQIILIDINGQYEFACVYYVSEFGSRIALDTLSGRGMGGDYIAGGQSERERVVVEGVSYGLVTDPAAVRAAPGYRRAVEYFTD